MFSVNPLLLCDPGVYVWLYRLHAPPTAYFSTLRADKLYRRPNQWHEKPRTCTDVDKAAKRGGDTETLRTCLKTSQVSPPSTPKSSPGHLPLTFWMGQYTILSDLRTSAPPNCRGRSSSTLATAAAPSCCPTALLALALTGGVSCVYICFFVYCCFSRERASRRAESEVVIGDHRYRRRKLERPRRRCWPNEDHPQQLTSLRSLSRV